MRSARFMALADQVLSNASNSLLVLLIAGASTPEVFGRFAVGYAILVFAVGVWRNGLGYQVSMLADDPAALKTECRSALAASALASPVVALPVFLSTALGPGADETLAWGLALATPFVLTQDFLRYASVAAGDAQTALSSDVLWTLFLVGAVVARLSGQGANLVIFMWLAGAVLATGLILWRLRILPHFPGTLAWLSQSWTDRAHLVSGGLVAGASIPLMSVLVAWLAGPETMGGVAGAGLLMAPTNSLVAFLSLTLLVHTAAMAPKQRRASFARAGLLTGAVTLAWGVLLLLVPPSLGTALLGETWFVAREAVPLIGLQYAFGVLAQVATLLLISQNSNAAAHVTSWVQATGRVVLGVVASLASSTVLSVTIGQTWAMAIWLAVALRAVVVR